MRLAWRVISPYVISPYPAAVNASVAAVAISGGLTPDVSFGRFVCPSDPFGLGAVCWMRMLDVCAPDQSPN